MAVVQRRGGADAPRRKRRSPEDQRQDILAAARKVFCEYGYAGATIDAVVERAGGSKATVYALFGNKEGLLSALVGEAAEEIGAAFDAMPTDIPFEETLRQIARIYLDVLLRPERMALFRLTVGTAGRQPEVGDIFYRNGPEQLIKLMTDKLRDAAAKGEIVASDPERLANLYIGLLKADLHFRTLLNPTRAPTQKEVATHIDAAIELFLNGCRPRKAAS